MSNTHLSRAAHLAVRALSTEEKIRLSKNAGTSVSTFYRWVKENSDMITKAAVVKAIAEEIELPVDMILSQELVG